MFNIGKGNGVAGENLKTHIHNLMWQYERNCSHKHSFIKLSMLLSMFTTAASPLFFCIAELEPGPTPVMSTSNSMNNKGSYFFWYWLSCSVIGPKRAGTLV